MSSTSTPGAQPATPLKTPTHGSATIMNDWTILAHVLGDLIYLAAAIITLLTALAHRDDR